MSKWMDSDDLHGRSVGPIAAWRLSLAVGSSVVVSGRSLIQAATTGQHLDLALGRGFGIACIVWIAAGRINRLFVEVEQESRLTSAQVDQVGAPRDVDQSASVSGAE